MSEQPTTALQADTAAVRALLLTLADRLTNENPDEPITETDRLALCHELTRGDEPLHSALRAASVEPHATGTRGAYAERLKHRAASQAADEPSLLDQYAAASQRCVDIAQQVGVRHCDEDPQWRAAEREAEAIWKAARAAGYTSAELIAAGKPKGGQH
ncbi:hypothetical protein [Streptomyces sp. NPDC002952]|uniref:hypothetical protein n=1 Tax=Streptomyces sp. NPDC002952 TaxID=3364673 RepID=UPI0036B76B7E